MIQLFVAAGLAVGLWSATATLPASAQTMEPDVAAQRACPVGTVWDARRKICVRTPRGSY